MIFLIYFRNKLKKILIQNFLTYSDNKSTTTGSTTAGIR